MAFKTFHIIQGLSRTPLLFIPRYLTTRFFKMILQKKQNLETHESENMKIPKPRFTNIERTVKDNSLALAKKAVPPAGSPVAISG